MSLKQKVAELVNRRPDGAADQAEADRALNTAAAAEIKESDLFNEKAATLFDWRAHLTVHAAADLFPLLGKAELDELAGDISKNGMRVPLAIWEGPDDQALLLDGRNRLDAMAQLDRLGVNAAGRLCAKSVDGMLRELATVQVEGNPFELVLSFNIHRRHLTGEQRRDLIVKLLAQRPTTSDRALAATVKVDHKTVGAVRSEMEERGEIPHVEARVDSKGRKQRSRKPATTRTRSDTSQESIIDACEDAVSKIVVRALHRLELGRHRRLQASLRRLVDDLVESERASAKRKEPTAKTTKPKRAKTRRSKRRAPAAATSAAVTMTALPENEIQAPT